MRLFITMKFYRLFWHGLLQESRLCCKMLARTARPLYAMRPAIAKGFPANQEHIVESQCKRGGLTFLGQKRIQVSFYNSSCWFEGKILTSDLMIPLNQIPSTICNEWNSPEDLRIELRQRCIDITQKSGGIQHFGNWGEAYLYAFFVFITIAPVSNMQSRFEKVLKK